MNKKDFTKAIEACVENGERLCYDAENCWNSPSGVALAILAQEEFAKAFILNLVNEGIIPWTQGIWWSIRDHECKHLFVLIMKYLTSIDETTAEWKERLQSGKRVHLPIYVCDAINIYRHEKVRRKEEPNWEWQEKPNYHNIPKQVGFKGMVDTKKQCSFYVEISKSGEVVNVPNASEKDVEEEIKWARDIRYIVHGAFNATSYYWEIRDVLKWVFEQPTSVSENEKAYGIA